MELTTSHTDSDISIHLHGRFDAFEVEQFRAAIEELQAAGHHCIAVDLQHVDFIDSTGLAELVRGMKRCRTNGGDLTLQAPSDPVRVILELTRLDTAFDIAA